MRNNPNYIGAFKRPLLLLAVLVSTALFIATAEAAVSRDSSATRPASSVAAEDAMPDYVHGLFLDMKGDYWGAIDLFRKVMAQRPADAAIKYSISKSWYRLAVLDSAKVYGEAAVKLDPANSYYTRYLAALSHDMRDYDRAAALYGKAAIAEPGRTDIMYLQGVEYLSANKPEEALEVFNKASAIEPYNEEALSQTLLLEIRLKKYPAAIETAGQLLALDGDDQKLRMTLAELYAKNGQETVAIEKLRELIDADKTFLPAWGALFDHYIRAGRISDFQQETRAFLDNKPSPPGPPGELARLFVARSGNDSLYTAPAGFLLDEIIARQPRDGDMQVLKGMYERLHGKDREALACFKRAVEFDARNVDAWENLMISHLDLGEKQQAFRVLSSARRKLPAHRLHWQAIEGYLLLHTGSPKKALAILETVVSDRSVARDPALQIQANINVAMACDILGLKKRSRAAYEKVLGLDAHNTLAMNNLAFMFAEEGVMLRQALRLATNAVMLEPDSGVYLDTLGWVHYKLGNYDLARQILEKAVAAGLDEPDIYRHLGEVYRKLGDEPKAKEMFEKAKSVKKR
jgi:tetratricopeptide (TPR) repeat protein